MDWINILTIVSSSIGIIVFGISFYFMIKIISLFPKEATISKYWKIALSLVVLFTLGYVLAIVGAAVDIDVLNQIITPIVYLFGSIFVLIMVLLSLRTYKMIAK